jgi:hypothetical protein
MKQPRTHQVHQQGGTTRGADTKAEVADAAAGETEAAAAADAHNQMRPANKDPNSKATLPR